MDPTFVIVRVISCRAQVFKQDFWLRGWGHHTAKRTMSFSNSSCVGFLDTGRMSRADLTTAVKTTIKYVAKDGRQRYKGSAALKGTQQLGLIL